jgi:hypothetical protein
MARPLFSACKRRYSFSRSYHTVRTPRPHVVVKQVTGSKYPWPRRSCARPAPAASVSTACINFSRALMAVRHARLLHFGYLITGSDPGFPRTALSAGTWRTRRACQCAPCIGSP